MLKRFFILLLALCCGVNVFAATRITLRSSEEVIGTIIFQNADVVVLRDAKGNRFQYPMSEIVKMEEVLDAPVDEKQQEKSAKKVGIMFHVSGGAVCDPNGSWGGMAGGDFLIGANNILQKHIFLGAGVGYDVLLLNGTNYSLLPIQLYGAIPLLQTKHAPFLGLGLGYGVSLANDYDGGLYAGIDFGWRVQLSSQSALFMGLHATFQQLLTTYTETIEDKLYTTQTTHTPCGLSFKIAIQL